MISLNANSYQPNTRTCLFLCTCEALSVEVIFQFKVCMSTVEIPACVLVHFIEVAVETCVD